MPHKISFPEAISLLHSYIYLSPFEPIKNMLPIGGHIELSSLQGSPIPPDNSVDLMVRGTRSWYISDDSTEMSNENFSLKNALYFSVAFESVRIRDTYSPERGIKSPTLYSCERESMIYPNPEISVNQFLIDYDESQPSHLEFTDEDVEVMAGNFALKFPCNPTSVAFFINDNNDLAINDFLSNEGITSVRFFYGYNPRLDKDNIRLILIGVDQNSNNIIGENSVILEKSWPPK